MPLSECNQKDFLIESKLNGFLGFFVVVEDGGGWAVLLQQCHPNSAGSLVIARRME